MVRQRPAKPLSPVRIWVPPFLIHFLARSSPLLYLVSSPIGNLADLSQRAIDCLLSSDYILCEDTRHSCILFQKYSINKPLRSYHKFNEASREDQIISDLLNNKIISLVCDAGTPGIADPGSRLVERCVKEHIPIHAIPGPCAAITALTCSGLNTERFQFIGFLPKKPQECKSLLYELLSYPGTTICYESSKRILKTLAYLQKLAPQRKLVLAKELTKKFEEFFRGHAEEIVENLQNSAPKGELVLMISGNLSQSTEWESLSFKEHVQMLEQEYSISKKEAVKIVAQLRGIPKRVVYNNTLS